jgi:hypothetical protein
MFPVAWLKVSHAAVLLTGIFGFSVVVGGIDHAVFAAQVGNCGSGLGFSEHRDDLFLGILSGFQVNPPVFFYAGGLEAIR